MPTIIEMVNITRLDCALGSATGMRTGLAQARSTTPSTERRSARTLIDQPLMRNVLADLAVESEAATTLAMRHGRRHRRGRARRRAGDPAAADRPRGRPSTGSASARPRHAAEAMECLGGNGYVEESGMPRLYREAPLMGIWEGSGNVSALDTLRAMATRPECIDVLFDELGRTAGPGSAAGRPRGVAAGGARRPGDHPVPGPQDRRGHLARAAGLAAGAPRPPGGRGGVPGQQARRAVGWRVRHAAHGLDLSPIIERALVKG